MAELTEYLPARVRIYKNADTDEPELDEVMLGEVTDLDDGLIEVRLIIKGRQHYVAFRQDDLRKQLADQPRDAI